LNVFGIVYIYIESLQRISIMSRPGTIVNIAGTTPVDDPEYRYKMPVVYGKVEGRGNGIKTVIPNIAEVALSLHRSPAEVCKFFGTEIGAQTSYNEKDDRAVVNGQHTDPQLQDMMHKYIEKYVICPNCGLPETEYKIRNGCIYHRCAACGASEMLDMSHKLTTFILAQHKKSKKDKSKKDKKKEKTEDGEKKKKKKSKKDKTDSDEDKKKKKRKSKKDKKSKSSDKSLTQDDSDGLADDMDNLSVASEAGVDDAGALALAIEGTKKFMKEDPKASVKEVIEVVANQQMASALKTHDRIQIFMGAAITENCFKGKEIQKFAPIFEALTQDNPIMQRHLIAATEGHCAEKPKTFPVMLKQFFDEDVLDEEVILRWAYDGRTEYTLDCVDEITRATLRAEAEPVVNWLQEEDSSDSDSD